MYFVENARNTPLEIAYIFLFLYYLPYAFGFYLGNDAIRFSKITWGLILLFLAATEAYLIQHLFNRYSVIGTRAEFLSGTAISLFSPANPIGLVMNGSVAAMVVYFLGVLFFKLRRAQKCNSSRDKISW